MGWCLRCLPASDPAFTQACTWPVPFRLLNMFQKHFLSFSAFQKWKYLIIFTWRCVKRHTTRLNWVVVVGKATAQNIFSYDTFFRNDILPALWLLLAFFFCKTSSSWICRNMLWVFQLRITSLWKTKLGPSLVLSFNSSTLDPISRNKHENETRLLFTFLSGHSSVTS